MTIDHPGNLIRREMVRCGYTAESLCSACDISPAVLRGILTDRTHTISTRTICALARAFDYSASDFIDLLHGNL